MIKKILYLFIVSLFFASSPNPSNAIWHWHKNIVFTPEHLEILSRTDFTDIFIHSGSFQMVKGHRGERKPDFSGVEFDSNAELLADMLNNFKIHLVYTFESWGKHTFYTDFMKAEPQLSREFIISVVEDQIQQFTAKGIRVDGVQMDLEGAGIDLSLYADLLVATKESFPDKEISLSPMVGWLKKKEFKKILDTIDFYAPMVYDYQRGKKLSDDTRITDINWIIRVVDTCESLKKPYFLGLPSYYYRIFYNEEMRRVNSWTFVDFEELSENKAFSLVHSKKNYSLWDKEMYNGDNHYLYRVERPVFFKFYFFPRGSHLLFDVITPAGFKAYVDAAYSRNPKFMRGISVFRYTKPGEKVLIRTSYFPYIFVNQSLIPRGIPSVNLYQTSQGEEVFNVSLKNVGNCESLVEYNSVQLLLKLPGRRVKAVVKNNFDNFDYYFDSENNTTYITFAESFLDLAEEVASGPITLEVMNEKSFSVLYQTWIKGPDGNYYGIDLENWEEAQILQPDNSGGGN